MSALRRRIMLWLWLLGLFSGRADGVAALLSARMVSSGSDAPVRAGRSPLEPIGMWPWNSARGFLELLPSARVRNKSIELILPINAADEA